MRMTPNDRTSVLAAILDGIRECDKLSRDFSAPDEISQRAFWAKEATNLRRIHTMMMRATSIEIVTDSGELTNGTMD